MNRILPGLLLGIGLIAVLPAATLSPAMAQAQACYSDADIRAGVQAGRFVALSNLINQIRARFGGQIVSSRLCTVGGRPMYLLSVLVGGQVKEVRVDAASGAF